MCKPLLAAVANAVFDATGVRLRRVPFRDGRVLAALKAPPVPKPTPPKVIPPKKDPKNSGRGGSGGGN